MNGLIYATHKTPIVPFVGQGKKRKQKGKGVMDNIGKTLNYLKDTKLISNTMGLFPNEKAQAISAIAKQIGLGKKKKARKPKQAGKGIFGDIGNGLGAASFGLGSGLGNAFHGLFGGKKRGKKMINM